jgi:hypothetical protein
MCYKIVQLSEGDPSSWLWYYRKCPFRQVCMGLSVCVRACMCM